MNDCITKYFVSITCFAGMLLIAGCGSSQKADHEDGPSTYDGVYDDWEPKDGEEKKPGKSEKKPVVKKESPQDTSEAKDAEKEPEVVDPVVEKDETKPKQPEALPARPEPETKNEFKARYIEESESAFDSSTVFFNATDNKKNEAYVVWAEHLYAALAYANGYAGKGGDINDLPKLFDLKQLKAGQFKNALGPSDDPRVKKAIKKWQKSTN